MPELMCGTHWAQLRRRIPTGSFVATAMECASLMLEDETFMRACGWDPTTGEQPKGEMLNIQMTRLGPPCCFIGPDKWEQVIENARRNSFPATEKLKSGK